MNNVFKKTLSLILSIVVCIGAIFAPISEAFAAEDKFEKLKTAISLPSDLIDVTLNVGADQSDVPVDIVYIMGGAASADKDVRSELSAAIKEILKLGVPVNFGLVGFSTEKGPILDLTAMEESTMDKTISDAIDAAPQNYDGINMENALLKAQKMLAESRVKNGTPADRQHMILISSGNTYFFNDGENNDIYASVPVNIEGATKKVDGVDVKKFFIMDKNWMQTRNTNPNAYPIPKDLTWDEYWNFIVKASEADIANGDKYKYVVPNDDFFDWYFAGNVVSDPDNNNGNHKSYGGYVKPSALMADELNKHLLVDGLTISRSAEFVNEDGSLIEGSSASHAIGNERAMYEAWVVWTQMKDEGINCYSVFNPMIDSNSGKPKYVNGTQWYDAHRTEYIGHSFMNMLAGGEAPMYSSSNKAFFDPIKNSILYSLSNGSYIDDYIGFNDDVENDGKEKYNLDFVYDDEHLPVLKIGNKTFITTKLETPTEGSTASYTFAADDESEATFRLEYFVGNTKDTEYYRLYIDQNISKYEPITLTHTLEYSDKSVYPGEHEAITSWATLYPVDSNGKESAAERFNDPVVTYVVPDPKTDITIKKVDENGNPLAGAKFELFAVNGEEKTSLGEYAVDRNGELVFEDLVAGTYELVETVAPAGYVGVEEPMSFEIVKTAEGFKVRNLLGEYVLHFPYTAYEISNHSFYPAIPQTFVLLEADNAADWTYSEKYVFGESDYHVVYCADSSAICEDGVTYIKYLVEDVFGAEAAGKLRAIIEKSYPYVSLEDMIDAMVEAGVADAENLTRGDVIAAVQLAVWHFSNGGGYTYRATYSVMDHPEWGLVYHDYTDELPEGLPVNTKGSRKDEASIARIDAMFEYLINLDPVEATDGEVGVYCYLATNGSEHEVLIGAERSDIDYYTNGTEIIVKNYAKNPATVVIEGNKNLDGEPAEDEFTFELWYNGKLIETVVNGTDGKFTFSDLIFDAEDTYEYIVKEYIDPENDYIDFDESVYTIVINVTTEDGVNYAADVTITKTVDGEDESVNEIVFNNEYKDEDIPNPPPPKDPGEEPELGSTAETVWTFTLILAMLGIVVTTMKKRKVQE